MAIKYQDWNGARQILKTHFLPEDDLHALRIEYDRYLVKRITSSHPHLTFKKYLAGKRLWDLCEVFDSARFHSDNYDDAHLVDKITFRASLKDEYIHAQ